VGSTVYLRERHLPVVTSRMSSNANANSEETASRPADVDALAINEAMVAALTAQVAELNERVARGLDRLEAFRSTDQRKTLAP
jgi:uncharacterized protein YceH (UPF0502 family)